MDIDAHIRGFRSDPRGSGFVLDFDGTLARIEDDPAAVEPVAGVPGLLERLASTYGTVAVLTGRRAETVESLLGVGGVAYHGLYGAEVLTQGSVTQPAEAEIWRSMASRLARDAEALISTEGLEGCEVEYKDLSVSLHYRRATDPSSGETLLGWAQTAGPKRGFTANRGRKVVELRPKDVSKAAAFQRIVEEASLRRVLCAGDDLADAGTLETAARLLREKALRVAVTSEEAQSELLRAADLVVGSPEELVELLERF